MRACPACVATLSSRRSWVVMSPRASLSVRAPMLRHSLVAIATANADSSACTSSDTSP